MFSKFLIIMYQRESKNDLYLRFFPDGSLFWIANEPLTKKLLTKYGAIYGKYLTT